MINAHEIREKLALIFRGKLSLNSFEDWFVPNSWNIHKYGSEEDVELVASIHLLFSERDDHILNEQGLRDRLVALARTQTDTLMMNVFVPRIPRPFKTSAPAEFVKVAVQL